MSERSFSFIVELPNSMFTFIHQVQPIIEKVNSDDEEPVVAAKDLAMEFYDGPPPSLEYVHFLEKRLL